MSVSLTRTVTLPVGVPPLEVVTSKFTVNCCPGSDGSGSSLVIVVAVAAGCGALLTVCPVVPELCANLAPPEYVAVRV